MSDLITREEYMANSSELFHDYYSQFVTPATIEFIKRKFGIERLLNSKCEHLNDLCSHSRNGAGSWTWDYTPIDIEKWRKANSNDDKTKSRRLPSVTCRTCTGKAAARTLIELHNHQTGNTL